MGGPSAEREISLRSGEALVQGLIRAGEDAIPIEVKDTGDLTRALVSDLDMNDIRVACLALHGAFGEDGTVQRLLDSLGIPYTGSGPTASRLAMDKLASRQRFLKEGLRVPLTVCVHRECEGNLHRIVKEEGLEFPMVAKPISQGSSVGVSLVLDEESVQAATALAWQYNDRILLEEFVDGREITVGVLDQNPLPVVEVKPLRRQIFDFSAKYQEGLTEYVVPAAIPKDIFTEAQEVATRAHKTLGCWGLTRVDMIWRQPDEIIVLEVNTIPGFTRSSLVPKAAAAVDINFEELCLRWVRTALKPSAFRTAGQKDTRTWGTDYGTASISGDFGTTSRGSAV